MSPSSGSHAPPVRGPAGFGILNDGRLSRWRYHAAILSVSLAVLSVAALLNASEHRITATWLGDLPSLCLWQRLLGGPCPGCGLSRGLVALAHGDVGLAWRLNPGGLLVFSILVYQVPYRGLQLYRLWQGKSEWRLSRWTLAIAIWAVITVLLAQWIVRHVMGA